MARSKRPPCTKSFPSTIGTIDRLVTRRLREWNVPGLALGIVRDGRILHARGFGLRDRRRHLPVDEHTVFAVGSCTKAFTATALGVLVDEEQLDWDQPLHEILPEFRLYDAWVSEHVTMRDILCHRTGLPRHELCWFGDNPSRRNLMHRLRHLPANRDFRSGYQYNNVLYLVAAMVVEKLTGQTWEAFVRQRVTEPAGLKDVTFNDTELRAYANRALGYDRRGQRTVFAPRRNIVPVGPAGAINTHVLDMCCWLQVQLAGGRTQTGRIISQRTLDEIHRPQVVIADRPRDPELLPASYGLGWAIQPYRGHRHLTHTGCTDGFNSRAAIFPDDGLAVVVLTNVTRSPLARILPFEIFDRLSGLEPADWNARARRDEQQSTDRRQTATRARRASRVPNTRPAHPLDHYAGVYHHPGYGTLVVSRADGRLRATLHGQTRPLEHFHFQQFELVSRGVWTWRKAITFETDARGRVSALRAELEDDTEPLLFARIGDA